MFYAHKGFSMLKNGEMYSILECMGVVITALDTSRFCVVFLIKNILYCRQCHSTLHSIFT